MAPVAWMSKVPVEYKVSKFTYKQIVQNLQLGIYAWSDDCKTSAKIVTWIPSLEMV